MGEPDRLVRKREMGIFTDRFLFISEKANIIMMMMRKDLEEDIVDHLIREGILYDLALVMCNETLFPVAKMQVVITKMTKETI